MAAGKSSRINRQYKTKYRIRNWREYERESAVDQMITAARGTGPFPLQHGQVFALGPYHRRQGNRSVECRQASVPLDRQGKQV